MGTTRKKTTTKTAPPEFQLDGEGPRGSAARPDEMPPDVLEFIHAIDVYKRVNQRPFPSWSEILVIVKSLGYARDPAATREFPGTR